MMKRPAFYLLPTLPLCALFLAPTVTRANAPAGRYTAPGNGTTVYDTKTGLIWVRTVTSTQFTWGPASTSGTAQAYCASFALPSMPKGSWRLPTVGELLTLVDYSQPYTGTTALIDPIFTSTPLANYWTSTPGAAGLDLGWYVDFSSGRSGQSAITGYVRCVAI
jgi:hypothetical protein